MATSTDLGSYTELFLKIPCCCSPKYSWEPHGSGCCIRHESLENFRTVWCKILLQHPWIISPCDVKSWKTSARGAGKSQNLVWQFTESQKKLGWRSSSCIFCTKFMCFSCSHNTSTRLKVLKHIYPRQWSLDVSQLLLYSHGSAIQFSCVGPDLKH